MFLAEDTSLGRKVAVKFLSSDKASDPESRQRFVHEARAQAMLSHPNIATFHEVGEEGEKVFIVMEYIDGQTLSRLSKIEKLSLPEVLDLAIQVGEGLAAAHEKGVVHRDIKPENVLVTAKHHAKITDFGLAKWKGASTLTQTGARMGTAYYMSPEQVEGKKADHRTDIFSLGIILYELLCARRPFEGDTETAIFYDLVNTHPQPLARYARNLPDQLEKIVMKCLAKKPEERYQHADELVADLKALRRTSEIQHLPLQPIQSDANRKKWIVISVAAGVILVALAAYVVLPRLFAPAAEKAGSRKMLVVLPFRNLGAPEQEYFADGITNEITANLAKVSGLGVISNTSAIQYKGSKKTLGQIGQELGAQYVLEGAIQLQATSPGKSRVRITPQLIRVSDDTHLWAETYDRVFEEIFELQSDISKEIALAMDVTLLEPERKSLQNRPTENLAAYDFYLRGNDYWSRKGPGGLGEEKNLRIALEMYQKAIELDSGFALAYANLSRVKTELYWHYDGEKEDLVGAKAAIDRAFQLVPGLPEAHLALGSYYYHALDYEQALKQFAIAQKSLPNNCDLLEEIGFVRSRQGRWNEALNNFKRAAELDPRRADLSRALAEIYLRLRKYAQAEPYLERVILLEPEEAGAYARKAELQIAWEGDTKKARKVLSEAEGKVDAVELEGTWIGLDFLDGNFPLALSRLTGPEVYDHDSTSYYFDKAQIYGLLNRSEPRRACYDSARILLEKQLQTDSGNYNLHSQLGQAYAGLGRKSEAIREGKKGVELGAANKVADDSLSALKNLAHIYVMAGEYDLALDQLEYLLSIPSDLSVSLLRLDPTWAPLRNNPRFKKLLTIED